MTPTSLRFLKALGVGAAVSLVLGACGGGGGGGGGLAADQTLRFPILDDIHTLDPGTIDAETDSEISQNQFNSLLRFDNNLKLVPDIASEMPTISSDGMTFTFKLRHDVTFWNGDKVTAKDFLYSWNRAAALQQSSYDSTTFTPITGYDRVSNNKTGGAALEALLEKKDPSVWMEGVTAPDDYTVKVQMTSPATWWLSALTVVGTAGDIVDQKVVAKDFDNWWTKPETAVGTGPYKLSARTPKASMEFTAVDNWWGTPKPTVKKVHIDVVPDQATAITKYEQGGYDVFGFGGYSGATSVADVKRIQASASEKAQLHIQARARTMWVSFNMVSDNARKAKGPFTLDQGKAAHDLRLAFALAVDKKKLIDVVCSNIICAPMTGGIIAKDMPGYLGDDQDPLAKFDPAQAKQLLQSADPTGAKTKGLTYWYDPEQPIYRDSAPFLQDQWQTNLGVHVELQKQSHSAFIKSRLKGDYVLTRDGWLIDYPHPQDYYDGLYGKNAGCPDANCTSGYDTKAFDDLATKANALPLDQGLPVYKQMAQMLIDDVVYIPLANFAGVFLWKTYVKGIGANATFEWFWNEYQILQH
jgi:oligopeptide transport system substrate-binding protein